MKIDEKHCKNNEHQGFLMKNIPLNAMKNRGNLMKNIAKTMKNRGNLMKNGAKTMTNQ